MAASSRSSFAPSRQAQRGICGLSATLVMLAGSGVTTAFAQQPDSIETRIVDYVGGTPTGGVGVAALLGAPLKWTMISAFDTGKPAASMVKVLLSEASTARLAAVIRASVNDSLRPAGEPSIAVEHSVFADEVTTPSAGRITIGAVERQGIRFIEIKAENGPGRPVRMDRVFLTNPVAVRLADALDRSLQRPLPVEATDPRWRVVRRTISQTIYFDTLSLRRVDAQTVETWIRVEDTTERASTEMTMFLELQCPARRYRMSSITTRDRMAGIEQSTSGDSEREKAWRPIPPQSTVEFIASRTCSYRGGAR